MGNRTVVEKHMQSMAGERVVPIPSLVREALKTFHVAAQAADAWRQLRTRAYE